MAKRFGNAVPRLVVTGSLVAVGAVALRQALGGNPSPTSLVTLVLSVALFSMSARALVSRIEIDAALSLHGLIRSRRLQRSQIESFRLSVSLGRQTIEAVLLSGRRIRMPVLAVPSRESEVNSLIETLEYWRLGPSGRLHA